MRFIRVFGPMLSAVVLTSAGPSELLAQNASNRAPRTITVSGQGSVSAKPDMVEISAGVQSEAATARQALRRNSATMRGVIRALKDTGIAARDIRTSNISVNPRYERSRDQRQNKLTGYRVNNTVRVRVRDIRQLGETLDQIVELGSNSVGGIRFIVSEADRLRDDARERAIENARRRAELLARAAGAELGRVHTITEGFSGGAPRATFARARAAESVPIEPGEQALTANVTVTWILR